MTDQLRQFLTTHRDLIEKEDYNSLYKVFRKEYGTPRALTAELTSLLASCGAEPWLELETIPPSFISTVEDIELLRITKATKKIETASFSGCPTIKKIVFETSFEKVPPSCFTSSSSLESVRGLNALYFGDHCFDGCISLSDIDSLENAQYVGVSAFGHSGLTSVTLGDDAVVCSSAFHHNDKLTELTLGAYLVKDAAFDSCTSLKTVTITNPLSTIGKHIFNGCSSLTEVTFTGTRSEFQNMHKAYDWRGNAPIKVVHCLDGDTKFKK